MSTPRIRINFNGNQGYAADQIDDPATLGELLEAIQEAIEEHGEDAEVVAYQTNNPLGAAYGNLVNVEELFDSPED